jgi:chromosome segregation ATPase
MLCKQSSAMFAARKSWCWHPHSPFGCSSLAGSVPQGVAPYVACSESRSLSSQLSALEEQCQHSQASQQEAQSQLAAVRAKLKAAEETAACQASLNTHLQNKLSAAEAGLSRAQSQVQQLQASHQALLDTAKQQQEGQERQQAAHNYTDAEVRTLMHC